MTGLADRLFALWYPPLMARSERAGQADMRGRLLSHASGRVLEVGTGNGFSLPHYTGAVDELVLSEPSPPMVGRLREELTAHPPRAGSWEVVEAGAEELPFDDDSFDVVTTGYVLCTVPDVEAALREMARVLRPGGRYLFLEHVRGTGARARVQDAIEPLHVAVAAGCHPNRRVAEMVEASPLTVEWVEHTTMPRGFPTVRPVVLGSAIA